MNDFFNTNFFDLTEDNLVISLPPPPPPQAELAVLRGDLVHVVGVFVAAMVMDSTVDEGLGLTDGNRVFLPSSMSRSKTNPTAAPRCGV